MNKLKWTTEVVPPLEVAGNLPDEALKARYREHNEHVIVSFFK